jgi:hypothetical protein
MFVLSGLQNHDDLQAKKRFYCAGSFFFLSNKRRVFRRFIKTIERSDNKLSKATQHNERKQSERKPTRTQNRKEKYGDLEELAAQRSWAPPGQEPQLNVCHNLTQQVIRCQSPLVIHSPAPLLPNIPHILRK